MKVTSLFPTGVGCFKFHRELTKKEYSFMEKQERKPNVGNETSANRKILEHSQFKELKKFIQESVDTYFKEIISPLKDVKLNITQSWLNYTEPNHFHHRHAHPNSVLSAVFYVNANPEFDKIYFYNPRNYNQIYFAVKNWNLFNSQSWWLPVGSGDLVIFPSHLEHSVEMKEGNNLRISLALNTFPSGYVGDDDSLTGLHL